MSDRPVRTTEPPDRLGRLAAAMSDALESHPEFHDGDKAVVMLVDDGEGGGALTHLSGYTDDGDAIVDMFVHLRAIVRAGGRDLEFIGIPDDAAELS